MNTLEKQLESWNPRHPSSGVKARIFPPAKVEMPRKGETVPMMVWLSPSACMLFLCMFLRGYHAPVLAGVSDMDGSNRMASLNSNLVSYTPRAGEFERQNVWDEVTFGWTKEGASISIMDSFAVVKTNIQKL